MSFTAITEAQYNYSKSFSSQFTKHSRPIPQVHQEIQSPRQQDILPKKRTIK